MLPLSLFFLGTTLTNLFIRLVFSVSFAQPLASPLSSLSFIDIILCPIYNSSKSSICTIVVLIAILWSTWMPVDGNGD